MLGCYDGRLGMAKEFPIIWIERHIVANMGPGVMWLDELRHDAAMKKYLGPEVQEMDVEDGSPNLWGKLPTAQLQHAHLSRQLLVPHLQAVFNGIHCGNCDVLVRQMDAQNLG